MNRRERKLHHKKMMKKAYTKTYGYTSEEECKKRYDEWLEWNMNPDPRNGGYYYWQRFYLSGRRKYAKSETNNKIRARYRNVKIEEDLESVCAPSKSGYQKEYDYNWIVW